MGTIGPRACRANLSRYILSALLVGLILVIGLILVSHSRAQAPVTYYVDASSGNDSNSGRSPTDAWRTIGQVNTRPINPGDRILFRRGDIWFDTLEVHSSGQPGKPITYGAYGSGPRPVIDGQLSRTTDIRIFDQAFIVIESLELRNAANSGVGWHTNGGVSDLTLRDLQVHHNAGRGIFLHNVRNALIQQCEIHHQSGQADPSLLGSGIDAIGGSGFLEIRDCRIYNNATHGIYHETPGAHIHHNTIYNNGQGRTSWWQHGIYSNADNTLVEYNEVYGNLHTGISMRHRGGICQYNTSYDNGRAQLHYWQASNTPLSDTEYRFNLCWTTRDTSHGFSGMNLNGGRFYNNTFYCDTPGWAAAMDIWEGCRDVTLVNNILYVAHRWAVSLRVARATGAVSEDYNWLEREDRSSDNAHVSWKGREYRLAQYRSVSHQGAHSVEGDPLFRDPDVRDFSLQDSSLAIDAGLDLGFPFEGSAPDMGGLESGTASPPLAEPDLQIQTMTVSPTQVSPGASVTVSFTLANIGQSTADVSTALIVLSADATITAGDTTLRSASIDALPAGGTQTATTSVTIPGDTAAGSLFVGVMADVNDAVAESDELNNTAAMPVTIGAPPPPPSASITVISPDGGEQLAVGQTQPIQWSSSGISGNVGIELSPDGGATYLSLFNNTANDGSQNWTVTGPSTSQALIRISSLNDPSVTDSSDGPFTITQTGPRTYYVDAGAGDDSNDGLSQSTAWRTMNQVSMSVFNAGDRVLFKRGGVWNEPLEINGSGESGSPITFGAYGSGARPVIDGQSTLNMGIQVFDQSSILIESLEVRHCAGSGMWTGGTVSDLTLRDLNVHHNDSNGIFLDHVNDVLIDGCEIHHQSGLTDPSLLGAGIDVLGGTGGLEIRNCQIYSNATHGIYHETPGAHIHHNTIYDNGVGNASFAQHGVYSNANNTMVEYNDVYGNLTTGISMRESGGLCQYNTCYDNGFAQIHYSQPDEQVDLSDTEFRFNVCWTTRDTSYGFSGTNMNDVRLLDNTFYCQTPGWTAGVEIPDDCRQVTIENNIICVSHQWAVTLFVGGNAQNVIADYNWLQREDRSSDDAHVNWKGSVYTLAEYRSVSGQGAHSREGDPLFQSIPLRDFSLRVSSAAIDAGFDLGLPFNGNAPDMGAIESTVAGNPPPGSPDLVIQAVSVSPTTAAPGEDVTVALGLANTGQSAATASTARIVLSGDETITTDDTTLGSASLGSLPAGDSQTVTVTVTVPNNAPTGSAFVGVIADVNNAVSESDEANNTAAAAITISQPPPSGSITLVAPNGGETLQLGQRYRLRWTSSGVSGQVLVELSRDGGGSYETLFGSTANDGVQRWTVTGPATDQAIIRMSSVDDPLVSDISDGTFSIGQSPPPPPPSQSITILTPNGGETWAMNTSAAIRWTSVGISSDDGVNIDLSRDGGVSFERLFTNVANDGIHQWWVSGSSTSNALLRITHYLDDSITDTSDQAFSVGSSPPPPSGSITLVAPNGGESLGIGQVDTIEWNSSQVTGGVSIELSRDGGASYETLFGNTANDGSESWAVTGPPTSQALIRVSSVNHPTVSDTSNSAFDINQPPPPPSQSITIVTPNGGETWAMNTSAAIRWTSVGISSDDGVNIDLSRDGGVSFERLFTNVANDGIHQWWVSGSSTSNALLRITQVADPSITDRSNQPFNIGSASP